MCREREFLPPTDVDDLGNVEGSQHWPTDRDNDGITYQQSEYVPRRANLKKQSQTSRATTRALTTITAA